jgi:cell division protein FtsW (lipid II flippase)
MNGNWVAILFIIYNVISAIVVFFWDIPNSIVEEDDENKFYFRFLAGVTLGVIGLLVLTGMYYYGRQPVILISIIIAALIQVLLIIIGTKRLRRQKEKKNENLLREK